MKKFSLAIAAALALSAATLHATTLNYTISGSGVTGSVHLTVSPTSTPGVDEITGISGSYATTNGVGFSGQISGLEPGSYDSNNPTVEIETTFDNLFYPTGATAPGSYCGETGSLLDYCGLTFNLVGGGGVNLYSSGAGSYYVLDYSQATNPATYVNNGLPVTFTVTSAVATTPEPSSLGLIGTGLTAVCAFYRKRRHLA